MKLLLPLAAAAALGAASDAVTTNYSGSAASLLNPERGFRYEAEFPKNSAADAADVMDQYRFPGRRYFAARADELLCARSGRRQRSNAAKIIEDGLRLFELGRRRYNLTVSLCYVYLSDYGNVSVSRTERKSDRPGSARRGAAAGCRVDGPRTRRAAAAAAAPRRIRVRRDPVRIRSGAARRVLRPSGE